MAEGRGVEPRQLVFGTSLYPTDYPPEVGGEGQTRTVVASRPRRVSSALDSLLVLSSPLVLTSGVEPASGAYKAPARPLSYVRLVTDRGVEPRSARLEGGGASIARVGRWPPLEEFNLRLSVRTGASCALDKAGCVLRDGPLGRIPTSASGFVAQRSRALAYEGVVLTGRVERPF